MTWVSAGENSVVPVLKLLRKTAHCGSWASKHDSCSEVYLR